MMVHNGNILGVSIYMEVSPQKMDGLFHGKSHLEMDDDWGTPISGNLHMNSGEISVSSIIPEGRKMIKSRLFLQFKGDLINFRKPNRLIVNCTCNSQHLFNT